MRRAIESDERPRALPTAGGGAAGGALAQMDAALRTRTQAVAPIRRLMTVPGIGPPLTAAMIYAWVGDVHRFPHAKHLAAYAGWSDGAAERRGRCTWGESPSRERRRCGHVGAGGARVAQSVSRQRGGAAASDRAPHSGTRGRRKIAVIALGAPSPTDRLLHPARRDDVRRAPARDDDRLPPERAAHAPSITIRSRPRPPPRRDGWHRDQIASFLGSPWEARL